MIIENHNQILKLEYFALTKEITKYCKKSTKTIATKVKIIQYLKEISAFLSQEKWKIKIHWQVRYSNVISYVEKLRILNETCNVLYFVYLKFKKKIFLVE